MALAHSPRPIQDTVLAAIANEKYETGDGLGGRYAATSESILSEILYIMYDID